MRVIAGTARSLPLSTPKGIDTRPTTDRIKETLFNMVAPNIPGSLVLDLFAGSGALGIEALSRGARFAYFIENNNHATKCIVDNITFTKFNERATLIKRDVVSGLGHLNTLSELQNKTFDVIFIDPPYFLGYEKKVLDLLAQQKYISSNTLIILETDVKTTPADFIPDGFHITKEKKYKTNKHIFIKTNER